MSTNNKVFQVLVTKGDKALAVAGTKVDVLEDGQLGIFDAKTNLAVSVTPVNKFYLAVGVTDGDGVDDMLASAGQEIQSLDNFKGFYLIKPHYCCKRYEF